MAKGTALCRETHPCRIRARPAAQRVWWFLIVGLGVVLLPSGLGVSPSPSGNDIAERINGSSIWETCLKLEQIGSNYAGFRYAGGPGASAAADWIAAKFQDMGLSTTEEKFRSRTWVLESQPTMEVVFENGSSIEVGSFVCEFWTIGTGPEEVEAPLVVLPCPEISGPEDFQTVELNKSEWNARNTSGCIVLTGISALMNGRWSDVLVEKLEDRKPRLIIYAEWYNFLSMFRPEFNALVGNRTWGSDPAFGNVPVAYVSYEDSLWLRELRDGTKARVRIQTHIEDAEHPNIVAVMGNPMSAGQKVIVCAHYDSALTPGFVDDGTGVSAMLEIAQTLSDAVKDGSWVPDFDLLFIAFDAEEVGCVGSLNYVADHAEELSTIRAVFSLDCLGACRMVATSVQTGNATDVYHLLNVTASSLGLSIKRVAYSGDHTSFQDPLSILDWSLGATQVLRDKLVDIDPVTESIGVGSSPAFQRDLWQEGKQGWIHTKYDNSTTALQKGWVTPQKLELQTKAVALTIIRMGEKGVTAMVLLGFFVGRVACKQGKRLSPLVRAIGAVQR